MDALFDPRAYMTFFIFTTIDISFVQSGLNNYTISVLKAMPPRRLFRFPSLLDLMDALSDPRAYMSAQEKREEQMRAMGIEDLDTKGVQVIEKMPRGEEDKKGMW